MRFFIPLKFIFFMALKVKAVERLLKFDKESTGKYRYVVGCHRDRCHRDR